MVTLVVGLTVAIGFGTLIYGAYTFLNPSRTARDRLRELQDDQRQEAMALTGIDAPEGGVEMVAERLGRLAKSTNEGDVNKLRLMLMQAGFRSRNALEMFNGLRVAAAIGCAILVIPIATRQSITMMSITVLMAVTAGYFGPQMYVQNVVQNRQKRLLAAFPDSLDLLVSSVEAGLGLDAAFRRVAAEMEAAAPELAKEFQMVNHEISAGISRVDALKHLEGRTGLDEVRSLVNMLVQAERFGTSIAKSLRVHARITRTKRMSRAEEEAAKVSPKLTVVMILFLLPVLVSVLLGPALIQAYRTLTE